MMKASIAAQGAATGSTNHSASYTGTAQVLAGLGVLLALLVMLGWHTRNDFLIQLQPDLVPMPYNSALLLLLASITLLALVYQRTPVVRLLAGFGMLFSALTMSQYFIPIDPGIDQLLMDHYLPTADAKAPGRMALSSTFCYLMLNTGFLLFTLDRSRWHTRGLATVCASLAIAAVIATLIGYKTNLQPLFGWSATTYMALHTALGIFMVSLGLLICSLTNGDSELSEYNHLPLAAAGFIVFATATLLLWSGLARQRDEQRQAALDANMQLLSSTINSHYREHINTLQLMAQRWEAGNGTPALIWSIDAAAYLDVLPGFTGLAWIDSNETLQRKVAMDSSLLAQATTVPDSALQMCRAANAERGQRFSEPQTAVDGETRFFVIQPLYPAAGFDGCLISEFSTTRLFDTVNRQVPGAPYQVEYEATTLYQSPGALQGVDAGAISANLPLALTNGGWLLRVNDAGTSQDVRSQLPAITLATGLGLAVLFSVLLGLWGISRRHLAQSARANLALAQSKQQLNEFRTTLDRTHDCVFMIDPPTLKYYYVNEGAQRLTGLTTDKLQGMHPWDINPKLTEASVREWVAPLVNGNMQSITFDSAVVNADGIETQVEYFLQYIAPANEAPRFVAILRDITQRKRVEQMKSEFVSTVSHELRTPLTSITGALGLVKGGALGAVPSDAQEMIDIAYQNSRRLTHLINDLLDIERIAAGKISFDFQVQPLMPLIDQALADISTYGTEHEVTVKLVHGESDIDVRVDSQRLLQILTNLLSNAIKFSPAGAAVEVSVELRGARVRISVRDYGRGIPEEFKGRIFQKFAQADSSDTRRQSGTGLGLAISRELTERMGGNLSFDSTAGQGACFYLELPISNCKPEPSDNNGPLLLVVEDEPDAARLLQQMLHNAGYRTGVAATGKAALAAVQQHAYAAVVLDLNLPDMSGMDIIQQLKAQPEYAELPVIVVSAQAEDGRLKMNGDDASITWLPKPVDRTRLLSQLLRVADKNRELCHVLHVEDDADLHTVVRAMAGKGCQLTLVSTLQAARVKLVEDTFAAIILDLELPDGSGWELLPFIREHQPEARLIILTGTESANPTAGQANSVLLKSSLTPEQLLAALHDTLDPSTQLPLKGANA